MKQILLMVISLLLFSSCSKDDSDIEVEPPTNMGKKIQMVVGSTVFTVSLYENSTAGAFLAMLPMTMNMGEMNGNEKYDDLPNSLPAASVRPGTIRNGDLMLYGSRTVVLFYETFSTSYSYTRIGRVDNPSGLKTALGSGRVTVRFEQIPGKTRYTLTYNANGATNGTAPSVVTADEGSHITLHNGVGFSRNGHTFVGWNTNTNGTGTDYAAGSNFTVSGNITLYAKWEASTSTQYTLTYNINGATSGTTPRAITTNAGTSISLNNGTGLSRSGYAFAGWNTNSSGTGTDYPAGGDYVVNNNATLYAKWNVVTNNNSMKVTIGNSTFTATLAANATATAFKAMLPLTLNMNDFNNNEKVCSLPNSLTTAASNPGTIHAGDMMLYGSSSLVVFYETFSTSYSYTRIGQIDNPTGLKAALGSGSVTIKFELE